jgi:hypothetical protein
MRYLSLLMVPAIAAGIAGCSGMGGPQQVNASAPTVTYRYNTERDHAEATQRAAAFCQSYGKSARLVSSTQSDLATFECL